MLTVQWQLLTPHLGAAVPAILDEWSSDLKEEYEQLLQIGANEWQRLAQGCDLESAQYAVPLGFGLRYTLELNAREAMQLIELRSGREGHTSYRAIALAMHAQISEVHPAIGLAMQHVDHSQTPGLERLLSEVRNEKRKPS